MKKAVSIFLLFSLLIPSAGTYLWFQYNRQQIRKEVKDQLISKLDISDLELLSFSKEERDEQLSWKHSKEFEYKGFMYDIVKQELVNETYYFWCWKDDQETLLNKKLEKLLTDLFGNDSPEHQKQQILRQFYTTVFQTKIDAWEPELQYSSKVENFSPYLDDYTSLLISPNAPPPIFS